MDRLPYGSGGFLLFQDSVVPVGIEPTTHRFSVCCSTNWATIPAPVYLCKGGGSTDTIIPLFCGPGRTRTSINWLTVNRNNLYTTKPILTTTWLLSSLWNSYHSFLVVQGVTHPSVTLLLLSPGKRLPTRGLFPCLWVLRESNSFLMFFRHTYRPLIPKTQFW